ncbi:MarC family protein [Desulfovibrio sp. JC010]|uniref:MarC family protein n=1 Tax=Desulfovibrio sp. JC010 TaxID=2593641 RepID=UPI0013D03FB3|nr:MarC family protein [Desulfovibrio sp. JC010]NDV28732.1 MarC family protein [Desulfovibrio sp. JC010]
MKEYIQAVITILALVNPLVCVAIFSDCVQNIPAEQKIKEALKALTAIGAVLFASALFGMAILKNFGISMAAFSCAGGGILAWIGANMLTPGQNDSTGNGTAQPSETSLSPLILFAASPGTITAVITISAAHGSHTLPITAIAGVVIALAVLAAALLFTARFSKGQKEKSGTRKMISSYMGVLIIAMGVQFVMTGISEFSK